MNTKRTIGSTKKFPGHNYFSKATAIILLYFYSSFTANAQSTAGITGQPDTSYTNYKAFISTKKTHPDIQMVTTFNFPGVVEKRDIAYCNTGNRPLMLDAFYPKQKTKKLRTAVLMIHGGGWRTGSRAQHYPLAQQLADKGYVCFTPEYRLSTEALYPAAVLDLKSAVKWVHAHAKDYNIDTTRIVVAGFSAGGELAAFLGATVNNPLFKDTACKMEGSSTINAVIDIDGILSFVHPESGEGDDSRSISAATNWFGYGKKDNPALWQQASALTYTGKHTPPTLFINSAVARMHAGREDYINILKENKIYAEVREFEGAPHSFCLFEPWFTPTVNYIDGFLKKVFTK